jgi:hypothetical protein
VRQKPKPNRNLKFSEKPNRNPTRPWVEDTAFTISLLFPIETCSQNVFMFLFLFWQWERFHS